MSYADIVAGLHERFTTVDGIASILDYEPSSIQTTPTLYTLLDNVDITQRGQVKSTTYRLLHRLVFRWQDREQCEVEMMPFVDSLPAAVEADPHLGGRISSGLARIEHIDAVWVRIANVTYRALDARSIVVVK